MSSTAVPKVALPDTTTDPDVLPLSQQDATLDVIEATEAADTKVPRLSKNAQKRVAREAKWLALKSERKARDKEARKEKKRMKAEKRAAEEADGQPPAKKARTTRTQPFKARIVIDLGFDDKMTDKEVKSLVSQLGYTYSSNRKGPTSFQSILLTSVDSRARELLERGDKAYLRWKGVDAWAHGYEALWEGEAGTTAVQNDEPEASAANQSKELDGDADPSKKPRSRPPRSHTCDKSTVVYLSADAEDEISELVEGETYILGGIVDRNRYKNLCLNKAASQGIRSARLPIGTYLANLPTRKVLTVNQVFDILLKWVEERDWESALMAVMPKRKFKDPNAKASAEEDEEGDGDAYEGEVYGPDSEAEEVTDVTIDGAGLPTSGIA